MNHAIAHSPYALVLPTHILGAVAFFMIVLAENGRIPIDNPAGTIEISMIEESRVLEYVFVIPWGLGGASDLPSALLGILALAGKLVVCGTAIVIVDSSFAKLRFFRIAEFLGAAFLLPLVGVATSFVIGQ